MRLYDGNSFLDTPQRRQTNVAISQLPTFDNDGVPVSSMWRVVSRVEGCGEVRVFNVMYAFTPDGKMARIALLPGTAAADYLSRAVGENLTQPDATYERFAKTIRQLNRHPTLAAEIRGLVGDVSALREIYEPALLDETTDKDARQMMDCVKTLLELVEQTTENC